MGARMRWVLATALAAVLWPPVCAATGLSMAAGASLSAGAAESDSPAIAAPAIVGRSSTLWEAGVVALVSACLSSYITSRILLARTTDLSKVVEKLTSQAETHGREIAALGVDLMKQGRDQSACELRCHRSFATHAEVAHIISENAAQFDAVSTKIGVVHGRVDQIVRSVGEISGYLRAQQSRVPAVPDAPAGEGESPNVR